MQARLGELLSHPARVKVKIQLDKLYRFWVKGVPGLAAQQPTSNGLDVALVGKLQHKGPAGRDDVANALQRLGGVLRVVDDANHAHRVKKSIDKGQRVKVAGHVAVARPARGGHVAPYGAGLLQQRARIVKQHHLVITSVQVQQPPKAGAYLDQPPSRGRQQCAQGHALDGVFVGALGGPESGAVLGAFVIADG